MGGDQGLFTNSEIASARGTHPESPSCAAGSVQRLAHHHSLSFDTRHSLIGLDLASNDPFAEMHSFSCAMAMMNILSKNDLAQNVRTGYSINMQFVDPAPISRLTPK